MKKILPFLFLVSFGVIANISCKKSVDDAIINAITSSPWKVTKFTEGGVDKTTDYTGCVVDFKSDNSFVATKNSVVVTIGTWSGTPPANFTAVIPTTAPAYIYKLDGPWIVTGATITVGTFSKTVGSVVFVMELTKIP
jgi:hypothetical protein